jgi:hypothetical protein
MDLRDPDDTLTVAAILHFGLAERSEALYVQTLNPWYLDRRFERHA